MVIITSNTILYCRKWSETFEFYKDKLKFPIGFSNSWFVEFNLNKTSRLSIANEKHTSMSSAEGKGITLTFHVEDLSGLFQKLQNAGLDPLPITNHSWNARVFYIFDPEGNRLEFWTPCA